MISAERYGLLAVTVAMLLAMLPIRPNLAYAAHRAAYDEAPPATFPAAETALARHRAELMKIAGVSLVYVSMNGDIVVRVKKLTPELSAQIPSELDGCRVRIASVEDVLRRHLHELEGIAGEDQVFSYDVENFPDGVLVIVVRLRRLDWENPIKVPTNIEGIPLRIIIAQDKLED